MSRKPGPVQTPQDLESVSGAVTPGDLQIVLDWFSVGLTAHGLGTEIIESARAISEIASAVRMYSHQQRTTAVGPVEIADSLRIALTLLRHRTKEGIELLTDIEPGLPAVKGNPAELVQVWTILIENGIDAMDGSGTIKVKARATGNEVTVEVADAGPGIQPERCHGRC